MPKPIDITPTGSQCPICKKPGLRGFQPFCSRRCADVDLGRWLTGSYVVPGEPEIDEDGTPLAPRREEES